MMTTDKIIKSDLSYDAWYLEIANTVATRSKDPSTKVGAVIVDSGGRPAAFGYNGFPRGVIDYGARWERPAKYGLVVHAEANAILNAKGRDLTGATIYITHWPPCQECIKLIAQSGIKTIYCADKSLAGTQWKEQYGNIVTILRESGIAAYVGVSLALPYYDCLLIEKLEDIIDS